LSPIDGNDKNDEIETGLDYILSHLEEPLFPRKISTQKSQNKQFRIETKKDIINAFLESNFGDCRINAYPILRNGVTSWQPNLLFIDLDLTDFNSNNTILELTLNKTLKNIKEKLDNGSPTVLMSGNGYHVILPVHCPMVLENIHEFQEFEKPSERFLRFAKDYLSEGKANKSNNPSFKSCLLRVPNSINSKYNKKVTIVQEWNGLRPPVTKELLLEFRRYLIQKKIEAENNRQKILLRRQQQQQYNHNNNNYFNWIETKILQTPFEDCRKIIIDLILAPYLINIKKLTYEKSYQIIKEWLDKCNTLKRLDSIRNFDYRISYVLKNAMNKGIGPMSLEKIETDTNYQKLRLLLEKKNHMEKFEV